ncbi:TetR/AcrR family transcriptional regulator [Leptospira semungkisensis]|uniref:TetR/AcrR family transcriptional regulator n=1 Tax=Leptospira semungkisensis TaxID=2484985 RepID=A0A4R9FQW3_9LEPT|nr:TetR/AcrR family transcriptional regulator [Leptospira semungkisensis]TGK01001.1 TetR/AcrR family transcriptional regulator [Leptospira semungkisensis]
MRYDEDHKSKTHKKIVKMASRQIRGKGLAGPAIPTLMKASGLTHGGFYKHFASRNNLIVEAVEESFRELTDTFLKAATKSDSPEGWRGMVKAYLSLERCDKIDTGCPIAALAPEIARAESSIKSRSVLAIIKFRQDILPFMPGNNASEKEENFFIIMSSMAGAVIIARTIPDPKVREGILSSVQNFLLDRFSSF